MKVKDIVADALRLIGRGDAAQVLAEGLSEAGEISETTETMLYCFNAVEDELARFYFPLVFSEEIASKSGKIYFSDFSRNPVKITSVTCGGKPAVCRYEPQYIEVNADSAVIEYWYAPSKKTIDGDSAYDGTEVGESLVAYGAAAEFCLINGESAAAELWESKYREAIDRARSTHRRRRMIPPRRWV